MHCRLLSSSNFTCASGLSPVIRGSGFFGWFFFTSARTLARSRPGSGL